MVDKLIATDYCAYVASVGSDNNTNPHVRYHNDEWGYPLYDDNMLFGRLILEINQAGLSWTTILNKHAAFQRAYDNFDVDVVASYGPSDRARLLSDASIIRNRMKIDAAIHNAQVIRNIRLSHGSFHKWLESHHPKPLDDWVKLFKETFKFTGGEITKMFLQSTGWIPNAHSMTCPVYKRIEAARPPWMQKTVGMVMPTEAEATSKKRKWRDAIKDVAAVTKPAKRTRKK